MKFGFMSWTICWVIERNRLRYKHPNKGVKNKTKKRRFYFRSTETCTCERFVTRNKIPLTLNKGYAMPAWFDLSTMDEDALENESSILCTVDRVHAFLDEELDKTRLPSKKVLLGGFSQGGALALYAALTYHRPLAGILILSCWIPLHRSFPDVSNTRYLKPTSIPFVRPSPLPVGRRFSSRVVRFRWNVNGRRRTTNILEKTTKINAKTVYGNHSSCFLTCSPKTCKSCTFDSAGTPTDTCRQSANNISASPRSHLFSENRIISENENGSESLSPSSIIAKHARRVRFFDRHQCYATYVYLCPNANRRCAVQTLFVIGANSIFTSILRRVRRPKKSNKINCFSQLRMFCLNHRQR